MQAVQQTHKKTCEQSTRYIIKVISVVVYWFSGRHTTPVTRGGTPLYKVYRYVPPQRVWFLSRFGLKTGIDFDNYGLKSGRGFGAGNIYESLQTYFSSQYVTGTTN